MKKPRFSIESHRALGQERLARLQAEIGNAYPVHSAPARQVGRLVAALADLRSDLDGEVFRENPGAGDELKRVYYPPVR